MCTPFLKTRASGFDPKALVFRPRASPSIPCPSSSVPCQQSAATFSSFPAEVVYLIAAHLPQKRINALARCSSLLYKWLNQTLYERNIKTGKSSALFWAAAHGMENTIKHFITFGGDVHLITTSKISRDFNVDMGLNLSLSLHERSIISGNALHLAIGHGNLQIVRLLLREGLDIEQTASTCCQKEAITPLGLVLLSCLLSPLIQDALAMTLINKGANVNACVNINARKEPLLVFLLGDRFWADEHHFITFEQRNSQLQMLLRAGADSNGFFNCSSTKKVTALGNVWTGFWTGRFWDEPGSGYDQIRSVLEMMFEYGADINTVLQFEDDATSLHLACIAGFTRMVKYLINRGADIEARNAYGETPLYYATATMDSYTYSYRYPRPHPSRRLISGEFMVGDPLRSWRGNIEIVELLLALGADPDAESSAGVTPRMLTAKIKSPAFKAAFPRGLVSRKIELEDENTKNITDAN